ncbi:MAG: DinB family protein [Marmoricola sp.]
MDLITLTYGVHTAGERTQLDAFLRTYRVMLNETLDGLSEDEARRRLVPSRTTLLGLVKHATYVEKIWFTETLAGTPRADLGLPQDAADSYLLQEDDTVASVRASHRQAFEAAQAAVEGTCLDTVLTGHPRIEGVTVRWVYLHMIRELAQHTGHAEILREIVLADRSS